MILYFTGSRDPYYNLACEEYLLRYRDDDIFMLWQNDPTVVIGKNQNIYAEVALEYADVHHIRVARRITGGGAVYHDGGNVNYSFITSRDNAQVLDFAYFTEPIRQALAGWGLEVELSGRNDLLVNGLKFSGNAQHATRERILHHGTLLFDSDLSVLAAVLKPAPEKLHVKGIVSVRSRVTNLCLLLPDMDVEEFMDGLSLFIDAESQVLAPNKTILELAERNRSEQFIFGRRENYDRQARGRFAGGTVTVLIDGIAQIRKIRIEGDFFGEKEIQEVEQLLKDCPLQAETLMAVLQHLPLEDYIKGVTAEELTALILSVA